jgi:GT2 family glycosyltransferase
MPELLLDVEISLANTNNRELLRGCLESLPAACEGVRWHVTVVENASTDGSAEMVEQQFPWAELVRNSLPCGFSANHNQVLRRAVNQSARYALILNEDTVLEPGSVRALIEFADANLGIGAAGPVLRGGDDSVQHSFFAFPTIANQTAACVRPGRRPRSPKGPGWLNGSCVLVRVEALRQIGLLDERFFIFFEDTDLGFRLEKAGWRSAVCSSARIVHYGHQAVSQPVYGDRMERQMLRSRYLYFRKHGGPVRAGVLTLLVRFALGARALKAFSSGALKANPDERALAGILWSLASYDPRLSLAHERAAIEVR